MTRIPCTNSLNNKSMCPDMKDNIQAIPQTINNIGALLEAKHILMSAKRISFHYSNDPENHPDVTMENKHNAKPLAQHAMIEGIEASVRENAEELIRVLRLLSSQIEHSINEETMVVLQHGFEAMSKLLDQMEDAKVTAAENDHDMQG